MNVPSPFASSPCLPKWCPSVPAPEISAYAARNARYRGSGGDSLGLRLDIGSPVYIWIFSAHIMLINRLLIKLIYQLRGFRWMHLTVASNHIPSVSNKPCNPRSVTFSMRWMVAPLGSSTPSTWSSTSWQHIQRPHVDVNNEELFRYIYADGIGVMPAWTSIDVVRANSKRLRHYICPLKCGVLND